MTTIFTSTVQSGKAGLLKILLSCGILASLLYTTMMMAIRFEGYSFISQTISELSAIGAPTRSVWIPLGFMYQILMIAFGLGMWLIAWKKRTLRVVSYLILFVYGICGFIWPFASMHQREALEAGMGTWNDNLHLILVAVTVPSNLIAIGLGGVSFGKGFRLYSFATIMVLLVFGILSSSDVSRVGANLPTPLAGIWERINIFGFMLWIIVLAIILLRSVMKNNNYHL